MGRRKRRKFIKVRKPRVSVNSDGEVRMIRPGFRVGDSVGFNVSSRGVSFSVRTPIGSYNTRRGCTIPCGCMVALAFVGLFAVGSLSTLLILAA